MLLGQHLAGRSSPGAQELGSLSILHPFVLSGPAHTAEAAGLSPGERITGSLSWPGHCCVLWRPSHELLIPRASRGSRELDAWQEELSSPPTLPTPRPCPPSGEMRQGQQAPRFLCWPFEWPQASAGHCQQPALPWGSALPCTHASSSLC